MKINIAASHRFHLLDLARELSKQGHDVRFYSYIPQDRAIVFGLKKEINKSLFFIMLPFLVMVKLSRQSYWSIKICHAALDYFVSLFMQPCDIYIALGTVYAKSIITAKKKFGAITILEWGSKHIIDQKNILSKIDGLKVQPEYFVNRSIQGYLNADFISIPSEHVLKSFVSNGVDKKKLIKNPYGVDLAMFRPTECKGENIYDVIFVGSWSYQKGSDLLVKACRKGGYRLLHVGSIVDLPFPEGENFTHISPVHQSELIGYYSKARVFVLPSRQDGMAMVQAQALACGLPIVCSSNSGGSDLKKFLADDKWILEMKNYTVEDLESCINAALTLAKSQNGIRDYVKNGISGLSWEAYGLRYNKNIEMLNPSKESLL